MIWYLLSPIRGTSDPPRLSQDNLIRRAFCRHGILTAQHWLASMLVSCGIAAALAYPTVFISGSPTAGFTSRPHQVWAGSRAIGEHENHSVDIEMRQVWVHGTYMRALDKDVLQTALKIQQSLVGDEDLTTISSPVNWGFHSPLMYWNNSAEAISSDGDVVKTINDQAGSSSSLEVSLRPASVFAGKSFSNRRLIAADALVLTLMNRKESQIGDKWQEKMRSLPDSACPSCQLYPSRGQVSPSWLYEFTFTPVTLRENTALAFAYGCAVLYVLLSLRRLKAFHSRVGLVVTAITQMIMSVLASFTICGMLKVNLTAVPRNAYPFILLVIGLENMFRLINAILAYPPTMATDLRIANALGDVGPLSVVTATQNLVTLWMLSRVVSPGIVAFCTFAAVATIVDTFFLLTFFVAVLNVDIRRLELQDSISRSKEVRQTSPKPQRSWFDALLYGGLPFSTRMAGSIVTTSFILTLNFLFFERTEKRISLHHIIGLVRGTPAQPTDFDMLTSPPMNATTTPGEWIRMQDFDTAREVMRLVDDGVQSFVIRIFAPLVVVLAGADRTGSPQAWGDELRAFLIHHLYPFLVVVVFIVTFVAVLMNFLLWNEAPEISVELPERDDKVLDVEHVPTAHKLDIVKVSCARRHIMSIALDRTVNITSWDRGGLRSSEALSSELSSVIRWPVHNIAIDDTGNFVAFHTGQDDVLVCSRLTNTVERAFSYPDHRAVVLFKFIKLDDISLLLLTAGGELVVQPLTGDSKQVSLPYGTVVAAHAIAGDLLIVYDTAQVYRCSLNSDLRAKETAILSTKPGLLKHASFGSVTFEGIHIWTPGIISVYSLAESKVIYTIEVLDSDGLVSSNALETFATIKRDPDSLLINKYNKEDEDVGISLNISQPGTFTILPYDGILGMRRKWQAVNVPSQLRQRRMSKKTQQESERHDMWEAYAATIDGELSTVKFDALDASNEGSNLFITKAEPIAVLDDHAAVFAFGNCLKIVRLLKHGYSGGVERHASKNKKRGGPRKS